MTVTSPSSPNGTLTALQAGAPAGSPIFAKAAAHHVTWLSAIDCKQVPARHTKLPARSSASYGSTNWSGYAAQTTAPNYAQAEWTVPAVTGNGSEPAYSSIWPGIGGMDSTNELIQDGTEQDAATNGQTTFFWFELYPIESELEVTNLVPNVGDDVATDVYWANGTADFTLCDYTQNTCLTGSQASPAPGNSAEWIVERPTVNGSLPDLANYGAVNLTNAYYDVDAAGNVEYTPANGADSLFMEDSAGYTMAYPGSLSPDGTSFTDYWESYK